MEDVDVATSQTMALFNSNKLCFFTQNHDIYSNETGSLDLIYRLSEALVKEISSDGHLQRVEGVLEREVRVQLVDLGQQLVDAGLFGITDN